MPSFDAPDPLGDSADPRRYVPLYTSECALHALADDLRAGRSPILLTGESGIGKTFLLRVLAERARAQGQRAVFSPFLHLPPEDVARWLLHLLGRDLGEGESAEPALAAELGAGAGRPTLLLVDEAQCASAASLRRLRALAGADAALVVAGSHGEALAALLPALAPESIIELPATLPDADLAALCDAILDHAALPPELRRLSRHARDEIVHAALGQPLRLKAELECRAIDLAVREPQLEPEPELELEADLDAASELELEPDLDAHPALELDLDVDLEPELAELELDVDAEPELELDTDAEDADADFDAEAWLERQPDVGHALEEIVWQLEPQAPGNAVDELDLCDWLERQPRPPRPTAPRVAGLAASRRSVGARARELPEALRGAGERTDAVTRRARAAVARRGGDAIRRARATLARGSADAASAIAASRQRVGARASDVRVRLRHAGQRSDAAARRTLAGLANASGDAVRRAQSALVRRSAETAQRTRSVGHAARRSLAASAGAADERGRAWLRAASASLPRPETLAAGLAVLALAAVAAQHDPRDEPLPVLAAAALPAFRAETAVPEVAALPDVAAAPPVAELAPPVLVQINARPWARIRVEGADVGPTPLSHPLVPGSYEFEAEFPDGRSLRRQVTISPEHRFVRFP